MSLIFMCFSLLSLYFVVNCSHAPCKQIQFQCHFFFRPTNWQSLSCQYAENNEKKKGQNWFTWCLMRYFKFNLKSNYIYTHWHNHMTPVYFHRWFIFVCAFELKSLHTTHALCERNHFFFSSKNYFDCSINLNVGLLMRWRHSYVANPTQWTPLRLWCM